jgi:hypothetical protein
VSLATLSPRAQDDVDRVVGGDQFAVRPDHDRGVGQVAVENAVERLASSSWLSRRAVRQRRNSVAKPFSVWTIVVTSAVCTRRCTGRLFLVRYRIAVETA